MRCRPLLSRLHGHVRAHLPTQARGSLNRAIPTLLLVAASVSWFPQTVASSVTAAEPTVNPPVIQPVGPILGPALPAGIQAPAVQAPAAPQVSAPPAPVSGGAASSAPVPAVAKPEQSSGGTARAETTEAAAAIEPASGWAKTARETAIWSGWDVDAKEFAKIGPDITVQVIEQRGTRAFVYFPGDNKGHKAGEVWVDRADLTDIPWPRWARARRPTVLRTEPTLAADEVLTLARGSYVETTGETRGRWAQAFFLADRQPAEWVVGWVDGVDLMLPRGEQAEISTYMLTRSFLQSAAPELWLRVPYRSQLDGSPYADANCGPTSVAMALGALGLTDTSENLREAALTLQDMPKCNDCGIFIQHLASVAEARGARTYGLRDDPENLHRWTIEDVRSALRADRVVIPQVKFRLLPGRGKSPYGGDHYIVITGIVGDHFLYNDPIDSDGRGYGRLISAAALDRAMAGATPEFSRAAFAVGR